MKNYPDLSIIIPLYNEAKRFPSSFQQIDNFFRSVSIDKEYILVDDGSKDSTLSIVESLRSKSRIRILKNSRNLGKGAALKKGVLAARGRKIFFTDADLSTPIEEFKKLYPHLNTYDVVVGSRRLHNSEIYIKQPFHRRLLGGIFYVIFSFFFMKKIRDTNCGFKCYDGKVAKKIFRKVKNNRWGFDAEFLYLAEKMGFNVKEVPVVWLNDPNSRVSTLNASVGTILELFKIKYRDIFGKYGRVGRGKPMTPFSLSEKALKFVLQVLFGTIFLFSDPERKDKYIKKTIDLYAGLGSFERLFTKIRFWDSPYKEFVKNIPQKGRVLDLGCGDGLLVNFLAIKNSKVQFKGVEINKKRIAIADKGLVNTKFAYGDILKIKIDSPDAIILFHVLHHLPSLKDQERLLRKAYKKLAKNGKLLIVEIGERPIHKYLLTWFVDFVIVPILFEGKLTNKNFFYRKRVEWENLLKKIGFKVRSRWFDKGKVFSHVLLVAGK